jgi:nucleoside-diphosphate-sugar epimerase
MESMVKNKILILGNLGYVGPELTKLLRKTHPNAHLTGFDCGYFSKFYTTDLFSPDNYLDVQLYGDVRKADNLDLSQYDAIIALAAISNDPIGNKFEALTIDVNCDSLVEIAKRAKEQGVKSFVFASSCSVYGFAEEGDRTEVSDVNPLTAYAKSKVKAEVELEKIASSDFKVTCLRFATACGMSDRLRLDLVLNDFVACAIANNHIEILSDGKPWRPLINVKDMGRAIDWAMNRESTDPYILVNAGSNEWNYQVFELANAVQEVFPSITISINENAAPDKRSYRVNFDEFKRIAPNHQPLHNLKQTILELKEGLEKIKFNDKNFRNSNLIRLNVINQLIEKEIVDKDLYIKK